MRYCYECDKCKYVFDRHHSPKNRNKTEQCPMCLGPAHRSFKNELKGCKVDALMKENERWSFTLGINADNPAEVAEARKRHPGAVFDFDVPGKQPLGRMRIGHRREKLRRLKERGMEEY